MDKIVIAGASAYGLDNLSDDCMLQVFCRELKRRYPGATLILLARHPSKTIDEAFGVESIKNLDHDARPSYSGRWYFGLNAGDPNKHLGRIKKEIELADALVIAGAPFIDNISIGFMRGLIPYTATLVTLARFLGTDVYFNGLHMGRPLVTNAGKVLANYCINHAQQITVRDESTLPFIQSFGKDAINVQVLADVSYGLDPVENVSFISSALKKASIPPFGRRAMGITFRMLYWKWVDEDIDRYTSIIAEVCDGIVNRFDMDVVLIPHNTYVGDKKYMDDRPGHNLIHSKCEHKSRIFPIENRLTVDETLAVYSQLSVIFSNRRHSAIWGVLQGVVPVATGEQDHVRPPFDQLGIESDLFLPLEKLSEELALSAIEKAIRKAGVILKDAQNHLVDLRALALKNSDLSAEYNLN